jgi:hypothetical protein
MNTFGRLIYPFLPILLVGILVNESTAEGKKTQSPLIGLL